MEENPEQLRGKQAVWHKDVKGHVFKNDEHVTVKRICEHSFGSWMQYGELVPSISRCFHMVFLLSLDFDSAIQPAITCALLLVPFRATDFLVMRGIVEVVWLIVEGGGMDYADDSATTST